MLDYTAKMREVIEDICRRHAAFRHIDVGRILVCFSQTRRAGAHGTHAAIFPMRLEGGAEEKTLDGVQWRTPRMTVDGVDMLYALQLYLPRCCDRPFEEKIATLCHELYHISPKFDGDLRRFPGRNWQHGSSRKRYDELMESLTGKYLASDPPEELLAFLKLDFEGLREAYGDITGTRMSQRPRLVRVSR
jgi:hypothetical protein